MDKTTAKKAGLILTGIVVTVLTIHFTCTYNSNKPTEQPAIDSTKTIIDTVQVITSNTLK